MPSPSRRFLVNATWLIKLRWVAVVGQVLTLLGVTLGLRIRVEMLWAVLTVVLATAVSNLLLGFWFRRRPPDDEPQGDVLSLVMIMDMLSLTCLLFATGGPTNPFVLFFFVNLSLSALILDRNWAWVLNGLSVICFAALLFNYHPLEPLDSGPGMWPVLERGGFSIQQVGLLIAFATCASVIVYFLTRLTGELRKQELGLRKAQELQARSEKLQALGTLAAGAAHELATPLGTIAVVARDVEHAFEEHPPGFPGADDVVEDVRLIRSQLDRCRNILDRMAGQAGQEIGETASVLTVKELVDRVLVELPESHRIEVNFSGHADKTRVRVPAIGLSQALRGLFQNAIDADPDGPIELNVDRIEKFCRWVLHDQGEGMSPETLQRLSEPFFTTKPPGKGMGLGVFLARNVIERLDGTIEFRSQTGQGTHVVVKLPLVD